MPTFNTEPPREVEEKKYPPTIEMKDGDSVTAICHNVRRDILTKYGRRDVLEVCTPDDETIVKSLWWPKKLPQPPLLMPFRLTRFGKGAYTLDIPETPDEQSRLWRGEVPAPKPAAAEKASGQALSTPASVASILAKFKQ